MCGSASSAGLIAPGLARGVVWLSVAGFSSAGDGSTGPEVVGTAMGRLAALAKTTYVFDGARRGDEMGRRRDAAAACAPMVAASVVAGVRAAERAAGAAAAAGVAGVSAAETEVAAAVGSGAVRWRVTSGGLGGAAADACGV